MKLKPAGKVCAPEGLPYLPGGLMRSFSQPSVALGCPGGGLAEQQRQHASRSRAYQEELRDRSALCHSLASGSWGNAAGTLRASASASSQPGTAKACRTDPALTASWGWTIRKAKDHVGYGASGIVNRYDFQPTAVSSDGPAWFVGSRTSEGPFSTRQCPVRRCPRVDIVGREMRTMAKTYTRGEGLSTLEHFHDRPEPPVPAAVARVRHDDHAARKCNLETGGCLPKEVVLPRSNHRTYY